MDKKDKGSIRRLIGTLLLSLALLAFYYFSLNFTFFPFVMWGYMIALAVVSLAYVIYNRGMSRKGVSEDMLPDEWDADRKKEYVEDGKNRLSRSRWMLSLIIAFVVTFAAEAIVLFFVPLIDGLF